MLYDELIKSSVRRHQRKFWGDYSDLNNREKNSFTPYNLFLMQRQVLRNSEKNSEDYSEVNEFLEKVQSASYSLDKDSDFDLSLDELGTKLLKILNSGYWGNEENRYKQNYLNTKNQKGQSNIDYQKANKEMAQDFKEFEKLFKYLQSLITSNKPIPKKIIKDLKNRLQITDILKGKIITGFNKEDTKNYTNIKAGALEDIVMGLVEASGYRGVRTGKLYIKEKGRSKENTSQLIQDVFVFDRQTTFNTSSGPVTLRVKGEKEDRSFNNLDSLLTFLENPINIKKTITLSDEAYKLLERASAFAVQAKSGYSEQNILNKADDRNSISYQELNYDKLPTMEMLYRLYQIELQVTMTNHHGWFNPPQAQNSYTLSGYANYLLSLNIAKTNITKNQLYFTKDGFVRASGWMDVYNKMLAFDDGQGIEEIDSDFITRRRAYSFRSLKTMKTIF